VISVDPLHVAGPTQGLQAADVGADKRLRILALVFEDFADALGVPAWLVEAPTVLRHDGNVPIRCSWSKRRRSGLHDHASAHLVDVGRIGELHVVTRPSTPSITR
jgi:hypothetical protein